MINVSARRFKFTYAVIRFVVKGNARTRGNEVWRSSTWAGSWHLETRGGEVWRSSTGNAGDWTRVVSNGFGTPTNEEIFRCGVFSDTLYAGTWVYTYTRGTEIWRSSTGNPGEWEQVGFGGFGDSNNVMPYGDNSVTLFNNYLYVGTWKWGSGAGEVWLHPTQQVHLPIILRNQ